MTSFVYLVVHSKLVVRKWSFTSPAVSQNFEALVDQTFFVKLLESPNNTLGVVGVQSLIVVIKINPASLPCDVGPPVLGVFQNRGLAVGVELIYPVLLNLRSAGNAQLTLGLNLGRKSMGVPAKAALNAIALHGFEPGN